MDKVDAYWNNKWLKVTFPAADDMAHCWALSSRQRSSWKWSSPRGRREGFQCWAQKSPFNPVNSWGMANLAFRADKSTVKGADGLCNCFQKGNSVLSWLQTGSRHTPQAHSVFKSNHAQDIAEIGVCEFNDPFVYALRTIHVPRTPLGVGNRLLIKISALLEWNLYALGRQGR